MKFVVVVITKIDQKVLYTKVDKKRKAHTTVTRRLVFYRRTSVYSKKTVSLLLINQNLNKKVRILLF